MKKYFLLILFLLGLTQFLYASYYWDYPKYLEKNTKIKEISDLKIIKTNKEIIIFFISDDKNNANIKYYVTYDLLNFDGPHTAKRNIKIKKGFYPGYDVLYHGGKIFLSWNDINGDIFIKESISRSFYL